jgi:hypothetical protein
MAQYKGENAPGAEGEQRGQQATTINYGMTHKTTLN